MPFCHSSLTHTHRHTHTHKCQLRSIGHVGCLFRKCPPFNTPRYPPVQYLPFNTLLNRRLPHIHRGPGVLTHTHMEWYAVLGSCSLRNTWNVVLKEVVPSQNLQQKICSAVNAMRYKWAYFIIFLHVETQCQVWKQFDFKKPEQHSVVLMLKKNLLKRLLISRPQNLKILLF